MNFTPTVQSWFLLNLEHRRIPGPRCRIIAWRIPMQNEVEMEAIADPRNTLNDLTNVEWITETKSVWFSRPPQRDALKAQHPATFAESDIIRLLKFFTKPADNVLDPFVGSGSTLVACARSGRSGCGIELVEHWADVARRRVAAEASDLDQRVLLGDARKILPTLEDGSFQFIVTSPPYWMILRKDWDHKVKAERKAKGLSTRYSDDASDLGNLESYSEFLAELGGTFAQCNRVLARQAVFMRCGVGLPAQIALRGLSCGYQPDSRIRGLCPGSNYDTGAGQQEPVSLRHSIRLRLQHPPPVHSGFQEAEGRVTSNEKGRPFGRICIPARNSQGRGFAIPEATARFATLFGASEMPGLLLTGQIANLPERGARPNWPASGLQTQDHWGFPKRRKRLFLHIPLVCPGVQRELEGLHLRGLLRIVVPAA